MSLTTRRLDAASNNNRVTIEPMFDADDGGMVSVYEHSIYERGSVLEGQPKRSLVECYETLGEATAAHPGAEVLGYSPLYGMFPVQQETPPDWFDPAAAGERWDDDY